MRSQDIRTPRFVASVLMLSSLFACSSAQNGTLPKSVSSATNSKESVPLRGGNFSGAYAGKVVHVGERLSISGNGRASFLGSSVEAGNFEVECGPDCYISGSVSLTSTRHTGNSLTLTLLPIYGRDFCDRTFDWRVDSGTGKFAQASGSGRVTFNCNTNGRYNDSWSGFLTF